MTATETHRTINAVWRIESARIIAGIARMVRDVGLAEDLAQDALVAALEQWPESGVPDNPGAWLMAVAKRRAIDQLRRRTRLDRTEAKLAIEVEAQMERAAPDPDSALDDDIGDDMLRLMFTACHPLLSTEARVALTLRLLGGLTTPRSRGHSWCPSRPSRSESCGPSARSPRPRCLSKSPGEANAPTAWPPFWR